MSFSFGIISRDKDAQIAINTIGLTNPVHKAAINWFVKNMKRYGFWSSGEFVALWPVIGGSASAHKWNLMDLRDLDAAYRLTFSGTITHASTGMKGNGTTGVANTHIIVNSTPAIGDSDAHISFYSRNNSTRGTNIGDIGAWNSPSSGNFYLGQKFINNDQYVGINSGNNGPSTDATIDTSGWWLSTRTDSTNIRMVRNGVQQRSVGQVFSGRATNTIRIMAWGDGAGDTANFFSDRECAFASVGKGMSNARALIFYQNVLLPYQTQLSRNV